MTKYLAALADETSEVPTTGTEKAAKSPSCTFCSNQGAHVSEIATPQPDPTMDLHREWLAGIKEPSLLLTLDAGQVRQAVAAGVVTRELAAASVLVVIRSPQGEAGPGAAGLLAIPKARYAGFSPINAVEALRWAH